jgi:hypothetical protein
MKQFRQESKLKFLVKIKEIVNAKCNNFLGVIADSNLSCEVQVGRTCTRISHTLFIINDLIYLI